VVQEVEPPVGRVYYTENFGSITSRELIAFTGDVADQIKTCRMALASTSSGPNSCMTCRCNGPLPAV
jgi:hypothetical protein